MTTTRAPSPRPCESCPYRKDAPSGIWHEEEYAKLREYDKPFLGQPTGAFHCHQQDGRLCAGWVGCHDMHETLAFRTNARFWDPEVIDAVLEYSTPVPLFESGQAAADHGMRDYHQPDERADRVRRKLLRTKNVIMKDEIA